MLTVEQLKPYLLHEHPRVRQRVSRYFREGYIYDPEIVPLALEACHRYGFSPNRYLLQEAEYQPVTEPCFVELLAAYREVEDPQAAYFLGHLLTHAPESYWEAHGNELRGQVDFDDKIRKIANQYHAIARNAPEMLWQNLQEYAWESDDAQRSISDIFHGYVNYVIHLLAPRDIPSTSHLCEILASEAETGNWLEIFVINLLGARRDARAIELLESHLGDDDDYLPACCHKALTQIGDPRIIHLIHDKMPRESWDYQNMASSVLGALKHPDSESAILSLRYHPGMAGDMRIRLPFLLFDLFSDKALDWGYELLDNPQAREFDDMKEQLFVTATINNIQLTEMKAWSEELRQPEPWEREDPNWKKPALEPPIDIEDIDPPHPSSPNREPVTVRNTAPKIGRNAPCPCGSGKKYKKCCGG